MPLIESLIQEGWLKTPRIIEAFRKIKRVDFLPEEIKDLAELNEALPIGWSQTISQPLVVAFMLELLQPEAGDKILDIGSGSGWTSALLAHIVSGGELKSKMNKFLARPATHTGGASESKDQTSRFAPCNSAESGIKQKSKISGRVIAIEVIPELKEFGERNVAKYDFIKSGVVECICADGSKGRPDEAPFDKILASATAQIIPQIWKEQLNIGGRIVAPIGSSIWLLDKKSEKKFEETEYPGFAFVPLISK